jgi:hypothetical protein
MKKILPMVMVLAIAMPLAGCIVRTGPNHGHRHSHARSCPPAHHWNGAACVHNGRARGHRR